MGAPTYDEGTLAAYFQGVDAESAFSLPSFDYTGSSNDPLFPLQAWFTHPATASGGGFNFMLGANELGY